MNNLKPCPFCGGIAELKAPGYEHYSPCWCKCARCGAEGPTKSSELEAEKGWNERAQDDVEHTPTISGWISVKDKLPDTYKNVITYDKYSGVKENWLLRSNPCVSWSHGFHVTHWMPLPEPPKEISE